MAFVNHCTRQTTATKNPVNSYRRHEISSDDLSSSVKSSTDDDESCIDLDTTLKLVFAVYTHPVHREKLKHILTKIKQNRQYKHIIILANAFRLVYLLRTLIDHLYDEQINLIDRRYIHPVDNSKIVATLQTFAFDPSIIHHFCHTIDNLQCQIKQHIHVRKLNNKTYTEIKQSRNKKGKLFRTRHISRKGRKTYSITTDEILSSDAMESSSQKLFENKLTQTVEDKTVETQHNIKKNSFYLKPDYVQQNIQSKNNNYYDLENNGKSTISSAKILCPSCKQQLISSIITPNLKQECAKNFIMPLRHENSRLSNNNSGEKSMHFRPISPQPLQQPSSQRFWISQWNNLFNYVQNEDETISVNQCSSNKKSTKQRKSQMLFVDNCTSSCELDRAELLENNHRTQQTKKCQIKRQNTNRTINIEKH
ncbi:unnamed protein product [Didymodactylos carnosus]|uniref:Uncharacterized protein n=1 Tax=Didymodactylos carnosus TaxID=1234261 RepID=A0A8S2GLB0_9BILA|nr:unnamed protein product [Didymodactylos carnosus]CAF3530134.1 unnamed protein product [Didymodactylos carnosus]